jgi:ABC-type lipoprotein export system ATPase subunit
LTRNLYRGAGTSFLLVTHNLDLARRCNRIIEVVVCRATHYAIPHSTQRADAKMSAEGPLADK